MTNALNLAATQQRQNSTGLPEKKVQAQMILS
jgi:hypothetical protein